MLDKIIEVLIEEYGIEGCEQAFIRAKDERGKLFVKRIKVYRAITGKGLKESKEWVESHYADNGRGFPLEGD